MKHTTRNRLFSGILLGSLMNVAQAGLILTAVYDGPLSGGLPKGVELFADADVTDLGRYGLGKASNGDGSTDVEFTFPSLGIAAGTHLYVATESAGFHDFFGFLPDYTTLALSINGDDAVELFKDGVLIDVLGEIGIDGTGRPWEYRDGWAYRRPGTHASNGSFVLSDWTFSGPDAWDGEIRNSAASSPLPIGSYTTTPASVPEPAPLALLGIGALVLLFGRIRSGTEEL